MSSDPKELERLLRIVIGFALLQSAALGAGVSWLLMNPSDADASAGEPPPGLGGELGGPGGSGEAGGPDGAIGFSGPGGPGAASAHRGFDDEDDAVAAYVRSLDRMFSLAVMVEAGLHPDGISEARERALDCEVFRCDGVLGYLHTARLTDNPIPPMLLWGDALTSEAAAAGAYSDLLRFAAERAAAGGQDVSGAPIDALAGCSGFDCEALNQCYDALSSALAPLEFALPPTPGLRPEGGPDGPPGMGGPGSMGGPPGGQLPGGGPPSGQAPGG